MRKWEYAFMDDYPAASGEHKADDMGRKGWEMVSATPLLDGDEIRWSMWFKREIEAGTAASASGEAEGTE